MSASGGEADIPRADFGSLGLNVRFSPKRTLLPRRKSNFQGPLSARSGRPEILSRLLFEDTLRPREQTFKIKQGDKCHFEVGTNTAFPPGRRHSSCIKIAPVAYFAKQPLPGRLHERSLHVPAFRRPTVSLLEIEIRRQK